MHFPPGPRWGYAKKCALFEYVIKNFKVFLTPKLSRNRGGGWVLFQGEVFKNTLTNPRKQNVGGSKPTAAHLRIHVEFFGMHVIGDALGYTIFTPRGFRTYFPKKVSLSFEFDPPKTYLYFFHSVTRPSLIYIYNIFFIYIYIYSGDTPHPVDHTPSVPPPIQGGGSIESGESWRPCFHKRRKFFQFSLFFFFIFLHFDGVSRIFDR